jgi:hypothetical protein
MVEPEPPRRVHPRVAKWGCCEASGAGPGSLAYRASRADSIALPCEPGLL